MRKRLTAVITAGVVGGVLVLTGCASDGNEPTASSTPGNAQDHVSDHGHAESSVGGTDHSAMEHPMDGGPAPEGIETATAPEYPLGTRVKLTADHMEGMDGAMATIAGAYRTNTYAVTYTPTTGGDPVENHKWVVQEELENAGDRRLADGSQVTLSAGHMKGMKGAKATIVSSTDETVYMVDYEARGMKMTNHKWVVESEIQPAS